MSRPSLRIRPAARAALACLFLAVTWSGPLAGIARAQSAASEDAANSILVVDEVLALPAAEVRAPALSDGAVPALDALVLPWSSLDPQSGDSWSWPHAGELQWSRLAAVDGGYALGEAGSASQIRLLAFRVRTDAFVPATLRVRSAHRVQAHVGGAKLGAKTAVEAGDAEAGALEEKVEFTPGDHTVVLAAVVDARGDVAPAPWSVTIELEVAADDAAAVHCHADGSRRLSILDVLDAESPAGIALAPDGSVIAVTVNEPAVPADGRRTWIEFVDAREGTVLRSLEGIGTLSGFAWAPGRSPLRYSFVTRDDGKTTLWVGAFDGGAPRIVFEGIEDVGGHRWSLSGETIVFSRSEDGPEDPKNFKRYRGLSDRWDGDRAVASLYEVAVESGVIRRLTAGALDTSLEDVAPDGTHLLFSRDIRDDATWPFSRSEILELDLATLETELLATEPWGLSARYSGDGRTIALSGPPQAFGGIGLSVPEESGEANLYESQLFLMDRATREVRAASRDLAPAIDSFAWVGDRRQIVASVTDRSYQALYRYDVDRDRWQELTTPMACVTSTSVADDGSRIAFLATSPNVPSELWSGEPRDWKPRRIQRFDPERFDRIAFGKVEDWDFVRDGETIEGHVYYPPDFDAAKKYPVIVYYYGGTVPVTRTFGGRYPKEWWAAQGYLVYVMQPSGATGFGQEFAARHVNNWGKTVADEIIASSQAFLDAHPYADRDAVGCIGASYGGFMTMLLLTRTDMFAAGVAHAGISSISSYWGEGNWGFSYSAAATAKSYPWNRPDIYVDQSPLFAADAIHTPLLLLHGGDDDNVPPGESEQLYTALRVLGREVEYIRIAGEKHWILQYDKRLRWSQSIVAWFDKHLKERGAWWNELWPADEQQ